MSVMGTCFDWIFTVGLVENLDPDCDGTADGVCSYDSLKHEAAIAINSNVQGRGALNAWFHENLHLISVAAGLELNHKAIYAIASGLTQAATSTNVVNEYEFEARLRRVAGPPEKLPPGKP